MNQQASNLNYYAKYNYIDAFTMRHQQRMEAYAEDSTAWHMPQEVADYIVNMIWEDWDNEECNNRYAVNDYENMAINGVAVEKDDEEELKNYDGVEPTLETENYYCYYY